MKKALALVLALVMVLSLAVSAFAVELVELEEVVDPKTKKISLETSLDYDDNAKIFRAGAEGGTYYFLLDADGEIDNLNHEKLTKIEVSSNGCVAAEMIDFDPLTMELPEGVVCGVSTPVEGLYAFDDSIDECTDPEKAFTTEEAQYSYEYAAALAKHMNNDVKKSGAYKVVYADQAGQPIYLYVLKVTVEANYTAAYKTGSFTVKAVNTAKKNVAFKGDVVSDVVIFEYEMVRWAAQEEEALNSYYTEAGDLVAGDDGYSDYDINGVYGGEKYNEDDLREWAYASVISTTAFRMIRDNEKAGISVVTGNMTANIPTIGANQKGVNFAGYAVRFNKVKDAVEFGYYGNQTIASDFTIDVATGYTWYTLREAFAEKVEEDDIIEYYILKDGKLFDTITVDYMTGAVNGTVVDINEAADFTLTGKAGTTLGQYEITLNAPANGGEENPNTGAESMIGVVAALAVVSVATAAAVSLKK